MEKEKKKNPIWLSQLEKPQSASMFACKQTFTHMCALHFDPLKVSSFTHFKVAFAEPSPQSLPTFPLAPSVPVPISPFLRESSFKS